jgi:hypothetical protein
MNYPHHYWGAGDTWSGKRNPLPTAALDVLHHQHAEGEGLVHGTVVTQKKWWGHCPLAHPFLHHALT